MAVEEMVTMNLVGALEDEDKLLKQIILMGNVHLQTNLSDVYENYFALHVLEEKLNGLSNNKDEKAILEKDKDDYYTLSQKLKYIAQALDINSSIVSSYINENFDYNQCKSKIDEIHNHIQPLYEEILQKQEKIKHYKGYKENIKYIPYSDINFNKLKELHFFNYKIGLLSHENKMKIIKNIENITAVIKDIGTRNGLEVFFIIYPKEYELETERILKSLNFEEIFMPEELQGNLGEIKEQIEKVLHQENIELAILFQKLDMARRKYYVIIQQLLSEFNVLEKIESIKEKIIRNNNAFILSGWLPKNQKDKLSKQLSKVSKNFIISFKEVHEIGEDITPPTKLKNPKWFKPFENLVKMYGIPSYNELDPTMFLSISYLIMFGAMFGDIGQGLVFLIFGAILEKRKIGLFFAQLLNRLGVSSIFFGIIYGSVFGNEELIPWGIKSIFGEKSLISKIIINPMENMNLILILSIVLGVIFILISFVYGIANSLRTHDIQEGLFGRNGIAGLIFYIGLLLLIVDIAFGIFIIPKKLVIALMIVAIIIMVLKEPLANIIEKKSPLYEGEVSAYYVESGFNIIETILSLASNTISFIRVGAFSLNHVGLFLAFKTMAQMANGGIKGFLILILGNIVVICLEGLIVFIQGLRLQYYELFGKYFKGEGIEFNPIRL
ncbi:MAG: V-type ATP synthase subunit I [Epulopiscium sp.]|jgi:V/A-type H+-transporting ATPase subunit I|nr:V-type ATP synthase subunit I [Candidatus Epulonipiscium sp.]